MLKNISLVSLLLAICVAGMAYSAGKVGYRVMSEKAASQQRALEEFRSWRKEYEKLLPVEERWTRDLTSALRAKDLFSVYELLGNTPKTNPDKLVVDRVERLKHGDKDLGANRVCLQSTGSPGVAFEADSFRELLEGLHALAARPDVQMREVALSQKEGKSRILVGELCLLMRDPAKNDGAKP